LSQSEIARRLGISASAVNQIENGVTKSLKATTAARMEEETGFSARWLSSGEGNQRTNAPQKAPPEQIKRISAALEKLPRRYVDKVESGVLFLATLDDEESST
jgi:transcriptional regulator with XRE-family HTH domain